MIQNTFHTAYSKETTTILGVPPKSETLDFCYFDIRKYYHILISSDKTLSLKRMILDNLIWFGSINYTPFLDTVIYEFC